MSDAASDTSDAPLETLVAGRAKRSTAGNRLSYLLEHLEDEDVRNDLLAEDETDQADYSASEAEDGDVDLESSDDDEDQGPPKEGEVEQLEGEKELKRQERAAAAKEKKRKATDFSRIPQLRKKVKLVEDTGTGTGTAATTPTPTEATTPAIRQRKKSERLSWLPTAEDAPSRQSSRKQTVANKEVTHAKLKESKIRSERQLEIMRIAAEKRHAEAGPKLTQADRMARALKVEKENARSLNRWEKSEAERQLVQREKLEALRNKKLEGPVIRYWSGSVIWEGDRMQVKPVQQPKIEVVEEPKKDIVKEEKPDGDTSTVDGDGTNPPAAEAAGQPQDKAPIEPATAGPLTETSTTPAQTGVDSLEASRETSQQPSVTPAPAGTEEPTKEPTPQPAAVVPVQDSAPHDEAQDKSEPSPALAAAPNSASEHVVKTTLPLESLSAPEAATAQGPAGLLDGIHLWASQSPAPKEKQDKEASDGMAAPADNHSNAPSLPLVPQAMSPTPDVQSQHQPIQHSSFIPTQQQQLHPPPYQQQHHEVPQSQQQIPPYGPAPSQYAYHAPPTYALIPGQLPQFAPFIAPPPVLTAPLPPPPPPLPVRAARVLTILENFASLSDRAASTSRRASKENSTSQIANVLLPGSAVSLTSAEQKYLTAKRKEGLPPAPPKPVCKVTGKEAKFRDPKTGIMYRDLGAFKALQRVVAGGCAWSPLLGAWAGIVGEGPIGRVARGVPEGFWRGIDKSKIKDEVKSEEPPETAEKGGVVAEKKEGEANAGTQAAPVEV